MHSLHICTLTPGRNSDQRMNRFSTKKMHLVCTPTTGKRSVPKNEQIQHKFVCPRTLRRPSVGTGRHRMGSSAHLARLAVAEPLRGHLQNGRHAWLHEHLDAHHDPLLVPAAPLVADEHHGDVASLGVLPWSPSPASKAAAKACCRDGAAADLGLPFTGFFLPRCRRHRIDRLLTQDRSQGLGTLTSCWSCRLVACEKKAWWHRIGAKAWVP